MRFSFFCLSIFLFFSVFTIYKLFWHFPSPFTIATPICKGSVSHNIELCLGVMFFFIFHVFVCFCRFELLALVQIFFILMTSFALSLSTRLLLVLISCYCNLCALLFIHSAFSGKFFINIGKKQDQDIFCKPFLNTLISINNNECLATLLHNGMSFCQEQCLFCLIIEWWS